MVGTLFYLILQLARTVLQRRDQFHDPSTVSKFLSLSRQQNSELNGAVAYAKIQLKLLRLSE
jgi:hypothetical protein